MGLPGKSLDNGALDRLRGFIRHHLTYHVERQAEVFIGNSELRSLEPEPPRHHRPAPGL